MKKIIREVILFLVIFVFVAFVIQADRWMQNPVGTLYDVFAFRYGSPAPPLLFTTVTYCALLVLRKFFSFAIKRK